MSFENELRLAYAVALNAVVLAAAYRFASRRVGGDRVRRLIDAGLIYYLMQYVVVGALGLVGLLSPWTIGPLALMLSAALWTVSGRRPDGQSPAAEAPHRDVERGVVVASFTFVAAYAVGFIVHQRHLPPAADDALTYHLPAAVQWLQSGRIGLFPTWFFNPANAYSPLGGSLFMAWLMAPVGNDALVRFVQLGPLLLMFLVVLELARLLGARPTTAALVAAAAVMTRSFINQVIVPKDDLFLTVFCLIAVMSLAEARAAERLAPWRAGASVGLLLATKYTALFSVPILLLMIDVPLRSARWRRAGLLIALVVAVLLAGPWFVRNVFLTGNPLFPIDVNVAGMGILNGLFASARSADLGVHTLLGGQSFYGPPTIVMYALILGWLAGVIVTRRGVLRDPLVRACVLGPILSVALFLAASPYPEVRFVYPAVALLFCCAAAGMSRLPRGGDVVAAGALLALVLARTLGGSPPNPKPAFAVTALIAAVLVTATVWLMTTRPHLRRWGAVAGGAVAVVCVGYAYVNWNAYLRAYAAGRVDSWSVPYGDVAKAWAVVDREVPPGSVIAYANTYFVYPLQGFAFRNRVVYVPVRPNLRALHELPRSPAPLAGEQIPGFFAEQMQAGADAATWRDNLRDSGADVLFIAKQPRRPPPELAFVAERLHAFLKLHEDAAAAVYRVRDAGALAD